MQFVAERERERDLFTPGVFLDMEIESISVNNLLKKKLRPLPFEVGCRSRQEGVYFHVETNEVLCAVTGHSGQLCSF